METFIYYKDANNNNYIRRDIYEKAIKNEIVIDGTPKIIQGHNTYQISKTQIANIEDFFSMKGIENNIELPVQEKQNNNIRLINPEEINPKTEELVVNCCSIKDSLFIPIEIISLLNQETNSFKKIKVDNILFGEVNGEELIQIRKNAKKINKNIQYRLLNIKRKETDNNQKTI